MTSNENEMLEENLLTSSLLLLLNDGRNPTVGLPGSGFRKTAVLIYTEGNVKVIMHKETDGQHHEPHVHIKILDREASFSLRGSILAGEIRESGKIAQWVRNNEAILTEIWTELQSENPRHEIINKYKNQL